MPEPPLIAATSKLDRSALAELRGDLHVMAKLVDNAVANDSTLTIRVKKADADALAAGKITEEEFQKRAEVAIY